MRRDLSLALFCSALALALPGAAAAQDATSFRFNAAHARFDATGTGLEWIRRDQLDLDSRCRHLGDQLCTLAIH